MPINFVNTSRFGLVSVVVLRTNITPSANSQARRMVLY